MKKITFTLLLVLILGLIAYYYAEKENINVLMNSSVNKSEMIDKNEATLILNNPESQDDFIEPLSLNSEWVWDSYSFNDVSTQPVKANAFTVIFESDGRIHGGTDCNNYFGSYFVDLKSLSIGDLGSTQMFCENSQESVYHSFLSQASSYSIKDLNLVIETTEGGEMIFHQK